MKQCSKCKQNKPFIHFYSDNRAKDGLQSACKPCHLECGEKYRQTPEGRAKQCASVTAYQQTEKYHQSHKKACQKYDQNPINKEKHKTYGEKYRQTPEGRAKKKISKKKWSQTPEGKASINLSNASRRAAKLNATPKWLTDEHNTQMLSFYFEAIRLTNETGIIHHVDHKVPLQGENVSGLHVPWNLQVIPAYGPDGNCSKGNKF